MAIAAMPAATKVHLPLAKPHLYPSVSIYQAAPSRHLDHGGDTILGILMAIGFSLELQRIMPQLAMLISLH